PKPHSVRFGAFIFLFLSFRKNFKMSEVANIIQRSLFYASPGLFAYSAFAEATKRTPSSRRAILRHNGNSLHKGVVKAYTSPFTLGRMEIVKIVAVVSVLSFIFGFDEELSRSFRKHEENAPQFLKDCGWYYGSPENHYAINGGFYLYGLFTKNETVRKAGLLIFASTIASGL